MHGQERSTKAKVDTHREIIAVCGTEECYIAACGGVLLGKFEEDNDTTWSSADISEGYAAMKQPYPYVATCGGMMRPTAYSHVWNNKSCLASIVFSNAKMSPQPNQTKQPQPFFALKINKSVGYVYTAILNDLRLIIQSWSARKYRDEVMGCSRLYELSRQETCQNICSLWNWSLGTPFAQQQHASSASNIHIPSHFIRHGLSTPAA